MLGKAREIRSPRFSESLNLSDGDPAIRIVFDTQTRSGGFFFAWRKV
jgi:hypothetical protein